MSQDITLTAATTSTRLSGRTRTRLLLAGGTVAGPLFIVASLAQAFTRPGFDIRRLAISMLTLGDLGWIQRANFVVSGLLVLACAVGLRRALRAGRGATWEPILFAGYGLGLVTAGLFTPDPALGFPAGAPAGNPTTYSWHAMLHTVAFFVAFICLIAACVVLARRFAGDGRRGWAVYSLATALIPIPLIAASMALGGSGVPLVVMGAITSAWVAAMPARLVADDRS
jgi:hypothetical membrane protein